MSNWIIDNDINNYKYPNPYYWDVRVNPNATWRLSLANCTTLAYGRVKANGYPAPVTVIRNAEYWHLVVNTSENWQLLDYYDGMYLKPSDIVEWNGGNFGHVAVVETEGADPYVSNSYYTGDNGSVYAERTSAVIGGSSLQSLSNYFYNNYPYRFYHYNLLSDENDNVGSKPRYVIRYIGEEPVPPEPPTRLTQILSIYALRERRRQRGTKLYT